MTNDMAELRTLEALLLNFSLLEVDANVLKRQCLFYENIILACNLPM
jgi:hypothetical protein